VHHEDSNKSRRERHCLWGLLSSTGGCLRRHTQTKFQNTQIQKYFYRISLLYIFVLYLILEDKQMKSYKELNKPDIVMISLKLPRYLLSEIDRLSDGLSLSRNKFIVETLDAHTKSIIENQTRMQLVAEAKVVYNSSREALADFDAIDELMEV
jgi:hypothetical protein